MWEKPAIDHQPSTDHELPELRRRDASEREGFLRVRTLRDERVSGNGRPGGHPHPGPGRFPATVFAVQGPILAWHGRKMAGRLLRQVPRNSAAQTGLRGTGPEPSSLGTE